MSAQATGSLPTMPSGGRLIDLIDEMAGPVFPADPVAKHGDPSRPGYAQQHPNGRSGMRIDPADGGTLQYGDVTVTGILDDADDEGSLLEVGLRFVRWDQNWAIRTVSARMMDLPASASSPRGREGLLSDRVAEAIIDGGTRDLTPRDAANVGEAVRGAAVLMVASTRDRVPVTLYRGLSLLPGDRRLAAEAGDEFEMPLSAFIPAEGVARGFAGGMASPSAPDPRRQPVLFEVAPGARAVGTGSFTSSGGEFLSQGRFRVEAVDDDWTDQARNPIRRMTLRQTAYFDPLTGGWVDAD